MDRQDGQDCLGNIPHREASQAEREDRRMPGPARSRRRPPERSRRARLWRALESRYTGSRRQCRRLPCHNISHAAGAGSVPPPQHPSSRAKVRDPYRGRAETRWCHRSTRTTYQTKKKRSRTALTWGISRLCRSRVAYSFTFFRIRCRCSSSSISCCNLWRSMFSLSRRSSCSICWYF